MKVREEKLARTLRIAVWVLSGLALIIIITVGIKYTYNKQYVKRIKEMEDIIKTQRSTMNVESVRQYHMARIIAIINQYNNSLPNPLKYDIAKEIYESSIKYSSLNVDLICALITHETNGTWNCEYLSAEGAMGLLQVMPISGSYIARSMDLDWVTPEEILYNPIQNIRIGTRYFAMLIDAYDVDGALAARGVGERRAAMWIKSGRANGILPKDTQKYIADILKQYDQSRSLNP